jgi:hypothetical protein
MLNEINMGIFFQLYSHFIRAPGRGGGEKWRKILVSFVKLMSKNFISGRRGRIRETRKKGGGGVRETRKREGDKRDQKEGIRETRKKEGQEKVERRRE